MHERARLGRKPCRDQHCCACRQHRVIMTAAALGTGTCHLATYPYLAMWDARSDTPGAACTADAAASD